MTLLAGASASSASDDCSGFLPDFKCDRQARPDGYVMPMSMPYLFEDPFITTDLNAVGIWQETPASSVFGDGDVGVIALQIRVAITEKLGLIATKDGLTMLRPATFSAPGIPFNRRVVSNKTGFMDMTLGLKYELIRSDNFILSPSLRYEIPLGSKNLFQGQGDGVFIPAISYGLGFDAVHVIGSVGAQLPIDTDKDSTSIFYNLHIDYAVHEHFVPFIEVGGMSWVKSGDGTSTVHTTDLGAGDVSLNTAQTVLGTGGFEGYDVANLGSADVSGNDIVTMMWGFRVPLNQNVSLGIAYERPLTDRKDIIQHRVTSMVTYVF